jgi:hypothetical protein
VVYVIGAMVTGALTQVAPSIVLLPPVLIVTAVIALSAARFWRW